ncbi:MAG TPA: PAS domain-containing protein, partial [Pseudomonadales bacterium]|nr:PAS domain-containing protein [Pseudomonadales bacterium]
MEVDVNQIIDVLPGLVWTALPNAHVEFLNQRWREYTGMELDEATGVGWQKAIHPDDLPPVLERWGALIDAGVSGEIETRLRRHDGTYRRFLIRTAPLFDATGRIVKWCGVNTEIEDQLAAEEASNARRREAAALRESERNLQLIIDTTPALIWSARPDGITDSVNRHFLDYLGRTWDALRDTGWGTAIHPADQAALFDVWNSLRHSGSAGETEARLQRHDGEYRWFLMRAHPLRDATGRIVKWYGVNVDIEAQKRAEAELERRAALLQQGETVSDTGSFLWRVETDEILWSAQLYRIFDVAPGTTVTLDVIASRVHPDDTRKLRDMTVQARAGRDFEYEHRLLLPDGSVKYLHLVAHATRNARGQLEFIGASQDVTERHLA